MLPFGHLIFIGSFLFSNLSMLSRVMFSTFNDIFS